MNTIDKLSYITNLLFNKIEDTEIDLSEEECDNIVNYSKDIRKELKKYEELKIFIYKEKEKIDKQIKELDPDYNEPIADCEECEMWSRLFSKQELLEEIIKEVLK